MEVTVDEVSPLLFAVYRNLRNKGVLTRQKSLLEL